MTSYKTIQQPIRWRLLLMVTVFCHTLSYAQEFKDLGEAAIQRPKKIGDAKRVAVLVGNKNYIDFRPLINPHYDVQDLSDSLQKLGFKTYVFYDLDVNAFKELVKKLPSLFQGASSGLFYYSGHGISYLGHHKLVPVNAAINNESLIQLTDILAAMNTLENGITLIDACRNAPYEVTPEIEDIKEAVTQGLLVLATQTLGESSDNPNGRNSLFLDEFFLHLGIPNLPLHLILGRTAKGVNKRSAKTQTPEIINKLKVDLVLKSLPSDTAAIAIYQKGEAFFKLQKYKEAAECFEEAYRKGLAMAAFRLGELYENGYLPKSYYKALDWYEKAALKEDDRAQFKLGKWYIESPFDYQLQKNVVETDTARAHYWLKKSVLNHNPHAQVILGLMYLKGYFIQKNERRAAWCFGEAAKNGYAEGQYLYGIALEYGFGLKPNLQEAIDWYRPAERQGHKEAKKALIRLKK